MEDYPMPLDSQQRYWSAGWCVTPSALTATAGFRSRQGLPDGSPGGPHLPGHGSAGRHYRRQALLEEALVEAQEAIRLQEGEAAYHVLSGEVLEVLEGSR
jgi:hypothetical protein